MLKPKSLSKQAEYRPELNGLRAVAVLMVLFFHLDFDFAQGGFLGVDVFLVISGYFITRNILRDLTFGNFSFYRFYTKRLRRLFPALIFTILAVLIAGYFMLSPSSFERLGESGFFASISLSNFFFWNEAGYFDVDSVSKPLLHMWSLSLEEQFYLFWPVLLVGLYRIMKKVIWLVTALLILVSVLLAQYYLGSSPETVFFLIPFRMFEFLLGAFCLWLEKYPLKRIACFNEILFVLGLVLIVASGMNFNESTAMPGTLSLIPCVGTMMVIYSGRMTYSSWILSNKAAELIGLASYSIYLIHWPLIVYYKYWKLSFLTQTEQWGIFIISIGIGILMWRFIENTFRYTSFKGRKVDVIWSAVPVFILTILMAGWFIWQNEGFPGRFSGDLLMTKEEILQNRKKYWRNSASPEALLRGIEGEGNVLVMGNSHAIDIIYALRYNGLKASITSLQTTGRCYNFGLPMLGTDKELCSERREINFANKGWKRADLIILHDHWPRWHQPSFSNMIARIRKKSDAPIFVIGPKLIYKEHVPEIVHASGTNNIDSVNAFAAKFSMFDLKCTINVQLADELANKKYSDNNIHFIDLMTLQGGLTMDSFKVISEKKEFLYFDASHLTEAGARRIGAALKAEHPYLFDLELLNERFP